MIIRKFNHKNQWVKKPILISIVIFSIIVLFLVLISTTNNNKKKNQFESYSGSNQIRIIWENLNLVWKTYSWEKSDYYDILFKSDREYWLKSNKFDLKKFVWLDVEIEGATMSFIKDLPVINLETIKLIGKNTIIKNNSYNFTKNLITFNFSKQNELKADLTEDDSIDISFDWQPMTTVETFTCNKINKSQDCENLWISYKYSNKDNFISYWWYTFYRYNDRSWITFNDNLFWYIFKDLDDSTMLDLSSTIEIINKEYVLTNKKNIVTDECQTNWEKITQIDDSTLEPRKENLLILTIEWSTNKKRNATCEVTFDLRNKRKSERVYLEFK